MKLQGTGFYQTLQCESGFKYNAYNPHSKEGSFGVAQFIPTTFMEYCKGSIGSTHDQLLCAAQMFKMGLMSQWDCYNLLYNN